MTKNDIPYSMLFFFEQSNEPWGVSDEGSRYLYVNKAYFYFLDIPLEQLDEINSKSYDFIPPLRPIVDNLISHDSEVMLTGQRHEAVGTIFLKGSYRSFWVEKIPYFLETGKISGTIFHFKPFGQMLVSYFINKPFYGKVTHERPTDLFTSREWDVLFLLFQGLNKKQISIKLGIKEVSVRNLISRLLLKTFTTKREDLLTYGLANSWHLYIPPRFSEVGYELISDKENKLSSFIHKK